MESLLPLFFVSAMGLALLAYVILDGYDLGIGLLLPLGDASEKDQMIASIGPFWDANETWIVLGVGILVVAFPQAHGIVLTALYLPVTVMLMGLTLRGVAFDFRVKAGDAHRERWDFLFFLGSLLAAGSQGWMLGDFVTGLTGGPVGLAFSALIALTLPALYVMLGAGWLLMKADERLVDRAIGWARFAVLPMAGALLLVSIATPLVSDAIAARWFTLPNAIGLVPIPVSCGLCLAGILWLLRNPPAVHGPLASLVFAGLVVICLMAGLGLAFSIYPWIVIGRMTIFEAAAAPESLWFLFWGTAITLPAIVLYTAFIYRIFHGRTAELRYD